MNGFWIGFWIFVALKGVQAEGARLEAAMYWGDLCL